MIEWITYYKNGSTYLTYNYQSGKVYLTNAAALVVKQHNFLIHNLESSLVYDGITYSFDKKVNTITLTLYPNSNFDINNLGTTLSSDRYTLTRTVSEANIYYYKTNENNYLTYDAVNKKLYEGSDIEDRLKSCTILMWTNQWEIRFVRTENN